MADPTALNTQAIKENTEAIIARIKATTDLSKAGKDLTEQQLAQLKADNESAVKRKISNDITKEGSKVYTALAEAVKKAAEAVIGFAENLFGTKLSLDSIIEKTKSYSVNNEQLIKSLASGFVSLNVYRENVFETSKALASLTSETGGSAKVMTEFGESVQKAFKKIGLETLGTMSKNFLDSVGAAKAFETSILQATTAGGSANAMLKLMGKEGGDLGENLDQAYTTIANRISNLIGEANITGQEATKAVFETMKTMPSELNQLYEFTSKKGIDFSLTTEQLMSKIAAGTRTTTQQAMNMTQGMIATFGEVNGKGANQAAERMSVMAKVAKDLSIPFGELESLTKNLDQAFALWGNQASGTMNILQNVSKGLDGTNVGFKGQLDIVNKLTTSIGSMPLGMRSFIGIQSGLRGGAVSAGLQVEQMLQEGKMGEVANMMQQAMEKQTGRKAITLKEANVGGAQAQDVFMQQRAMLQTMGISGEATQNRMLEIMSKTSIGGTTGIDAQNEMKEALNKGNDLQDKQRSDSANLLAQGIELNTLIGSHTAYLNSIKNASETTAGKISRENVQKEQAAGTAGNISAVDLSAKGVSNLAQGTIGGAIGLFKTSIATVKTAYENSIEAIKADKNTSEESKNIDIEKVENIKTEGLKIAKSNIKLLLTKLGAKEEITPLLANEGMGDEESKPTLPKPPKIGVKLKGKRESKIELPEEERPTLNGRTGAARSSAEKEKQQGVGGSPEAHVYVHIVDEKGNEIASQNINLTMQRIAKEALRKGGS